MLATLFITAIVVNPPERKLAKRTSAHGKGSREFFQSKIQKDKRQIYKGLIPIEFIAWLSLVGLSKASRHSPFFNVNRLVFEWSFIANYNRVN